jgi:hypothetical protein
MADKPGEKSQGKVLDSGYFEGAAFSDLLSVLFRKRLTGALQVSRENLVKVLHFQEGALCWVTTDVASEKEALERENGSQLESIVKDIFAWSGGGFRVIQGPAPRRSLPPVNLFALIYEGSASFSSDVLRGLVFRLDGIVLSRSGANALAETVVLGASERKLLAELDGRRTVGELLRAVPTANPGGIRFLYALHCLGEAVPGGPSTSPDGYARAERALIGKVERETPVPSRVDTARMLAAEGSFHRAKSLLSKKNFEAAHAQLVEATQLDGEEGDYHAYLGWTRFQMNPGDPLAVASALEAFAKALELNPRSDKGYLFRGYVHESRGDRAQAQADYERALQCNADSHDALRALRRMNSRVA